jgi:hypothetical protein
MTNEEKFVNELIGYIFAYPDDDYMTMECLCRKLFKYGLIEKKDGEWTTDFIDRKTEPQYSEDDMYWLSLAEDVANGKMSDAGANQAWLEYINHKDEPTISKMEQVEEPSGYCNECRWYGDKQVCGRCRSRNLYAPMDEPQTDCFVCKREGKDVCWDCVIKPQTESE